MTALPEGLPPYISDTRQSSATLDAALQVLGLRREYLWDAARAGVARRHTTSRFEPTTAGGLNDWIARTGRFRELMHGLNWELVDPVNSPFVRSSDRTVMVGVMRGNEATGDPSGALVSHYPKGTVTAKLTLRNEELEPGFPEFDNLRGGKPEIEAAKVWFFVTRYERDTTAQVDRVYAEVSQPEPTEVDKKVSRWARRLCLDPFEFPIIGPDEEPGEPTEFEVTLR